jgi:hypothetical protein
MPLVEEQVKLRKGLQVGNEVFRKGKSENQNSNIQELVTFH